MQIHPKMNTPDDKHLDMNNESRARETFNHLVHCLEIVSEYHLSDSKEAKAIKVRESKLSLSELEKNIKEALNNKTIESEINFLRIHIKSIERQLDTDNKIASLLCKHIKNKAPLKQLSPKHFKDKSPVSSTSSNDDLYTINEEATTQESYDHLCHCLSVLVHYEDQEKGSVKALIPRKESLNLKEKEDIISKFIQSDSVLETINEIKKNKHSLTPKPDYLDIHDTLMRLL